MSGYASAGNGGADMITVGFSGGSPSSYKLVSLFVAEVWGVPTFSIVHSSGNGSSSQCSVSSFNSTSLIFGGCAIGGIHTVPTQTTGFAPIAFNYNSYFAMDQVQSNPNTRSFHISNELISIE